MVGRRVSVAQSPAQAFPLAFVAMSLDGRDSSMPTGQSPVTSGVITVRGAMKHIGAPQNLPMPPYSRTPPLTLHRRRNSL